MPTMLARQQRTELSGDAASGAPPTGGFVRDRAAGPAPGALFNGGEFSVRVETADSYGHHSIHSLGSLK